MKENPAWEADVEPGVRAQGFALVAVLVVLIAFVSILMAFSTSNTPHSVDGDKAEYSRWVPSEG